MKSPFEVPTCVVISPWRTNSEHTVEEHREFLRKIMHTLHTAGFAPYAPHAEILLGALDDNVAEEREAGICHGLAIGRMLDYAFIFTEMGLSDGMIEEINFYMESGVELCSFASLEHASPIFEEMAAEFSPPPTDPDGGGMAG